MSEERVKAFVRKTLGCDCSEDVFSHIENEKGVKAAGIALKNKINVGNRLLVYIVDGDKEPLKRMPKLLEAGKDERDSRGFNRFRLVLVSDDIGLRKEAFEAFKTIPGLDEKIHLHVIGNDGIRGL